VAEIFELLGRKTVVDRLVFVIDKFSNSNLLDDDIVSDEVSQ